MENNAPPCVILKTITVKRGLLLKSSKNLHGKLSIPARCVESNPKEKESITVDYAEMVNLSQWVLA